MAGSYRVVFLIGQFGMGGSERQLYLLLRNLDRTKFSSTVIVFNPSPNLTYENELRDLGIEIVRIPGSCRGIRQRGFWLHRYYRKSRPDIVHSWTVHDNPFAGIVGAAAGVSVRLGSVRGSMKLEGFQSLPRVYRYLCLRSVSRLVVNSRSIAEELVESGIRRSNVFVLPNCVERSDSPTRTADLSEFGIEPDDVVVGTVGNLRPVKNHLLFVRALARVLPARPKVKAVIVGHPISSFPRIHDAVVREIEDNNLRGRILLTGFRPDVSSLMKRFDVFCLTSDSEGLPNVILEAMVEGVSVVATSVGGVPEIVVDGETGFLVKPGDESTLASRVATLLDRPTIRKEMGDRGRLRAETNHDCTDQVRRLEEFYGQAVTAGSGPFRRRRESRKS